MSRPTDWTRDQTLAALHVYFQLPFGQLHQRNPLIQHLAEWIGRTPGSVALKLVNFASLDPQVRASGRAGMSNASLRIPLMADSDSIPIADSVPGDGGHVARVS